MLNFGLKGKTVVVTGGASGIGRATVDALVGDGAKVAIVDLEQESIDACVKELKDGGADAIGFAADVRDEDAVVRVAGEIDSAFGPIYGLVACAGTSAAAPAENHSAEDWSRVLDVNALGMFLTCKVFGKYMLEAGEGAVVCIGSTDGLGAQPARIAYNASKFAVNGIVKTLALEWGRHNVRVNCIAPTVIDTPLVRRGLPQNFLDLVSDRTPMVRMGQGSDIAKPVLMLLSDAASFITGIVMPVDGGLTTGWFTRKHGADLCSKRLLEAGVYEE